MSTLFYTMLPRRPYGIAEEPLPQNRPRRPGACAAPKNSDASKNFQRNTYPLCAPGGVSAR